MWALLNGLPPLPNPQLLRFSHQGFGMLLMEEAERIAREEHGSGKIAVISGNPGGRIHDPVSFWVCYSGAIQLSPLLPLSVITVFFTGPGSHKGLVPIIQDPHESRVAGWSCEKLSIWARTRHPALLSATLPPYLTPHLCFVPSYCLRKWIWRIWI